MTTPPLATVEELGTKLGITIPDDLVTRAEQVLFDASSTVRAEAGQTWLDDTGSLTVVPDDIITMTLRVAAKMWANPTETTQRTAGPFSESLQGLLDDNDRTTLNRHRPFSGLGTISTTRGCLETPAVCDEWGDDCVPWP